MNDLQKWMTPIWDTDRMYDESLMMVRDENGLACAPLLYDPIDILSVTNAAGNIAYEENRDWIYRDGLFCLTPDSRIFSFAREELYPAEAIPGHSFPAADGHILYGEGTFFHDRQIAVTYTCRCGGWTGVKPAFAGEQLPKTVDRLRRRLPLRIMVYGDSISVGANASEITGGAPHQPAYFGLFCQALARHYGSEVSYENESVGGVGVGWGVENILERVLSHDFDLILIAFGMNDAQISPEDFAASIRNMIRDVHAEKPDAEIILIATSTPNPILTHPDAQFVGNQAQFKQALDRISSECRNGVAVADITGMQAFLHSRKRFIDTTGNHVNHPNDFFHRCYAQFLAGMLKDDCFSASCALLF